MTDTPVGVFGSDEGEAVATLRETEARELFVSLGKALRAYQLYEENNPVYQRFLTALRENFQHVWKGEDQLLVAVEENRLLLDGIPVYVNESRSDSLAFLFYKDGVREVTFFPGIEDEELERLLSVLHRVRYVGQDSDDVLTMLWEEGLQNFKYRYIDYLAEGVVIPDAGPGADAAQLAAAREDAVGGAAEAEEALEPANGEPGEGAASPLQTVDQGSFNPTLYAFDAKEMEELDRELRLEIERDLRGDVLNALFDRLEEPYDVSQQSEILGVIRSLLPNMLGRGAVSAAAEVLRELRVMEARPDLFDEVRRQQVGRLMEEVSSPQVMGELVHALEDGSIKPSPGELGDFLVNLRPQALAWLLRASETVEVRELQPVLRDAVTGIASQHKKLLVELVSSPDALVASGAARLAGTLGVTEAGAAVRELLRHRDAEARLAAVEAGMMLKDSSVAAAVQDSLTDEDRAVRIAAAKALGKLRFRPAAQRFRTLLTSKEMRAADVTEKIAFFEGYAELGDREAVPILDKLLNAKGLLGRREPTDMRAAAALALGKIATAEAMAALESARADDDAVVKSAVNRAFREGREAGGRR